MKEAISQFSDSTPGQKIDGAFYSEPLNCRDLIKLPLQFIPIDVEIVNNALGKIAKIAGSPKPGLDCKRLLKPNC
jgi:hypothetical protein